MKDAKTEVAAAPAAAGRGRAEPGPTPDKTVYKVEAGNAPVARAEERRPSRW